jgi:hypothetical protein
MQLVRSLLGVEWRELDRGDVESFLAEQGDEGLTWECKGKGDKGEDRWPRRQQIEKAVSGFANSELGGLLIIGADRTHPKKLGWKLNGLPPPPEPEIKMAVSKVIDWGVAPVPPYDVQAWRIGEDRHAAVAWVRPTPEPPCVTRDGLVFQRTVGRTEPVSDPGALARLFEGGNRARERAEGLPSEPPRRS